MNVLDQQIILKTLDIDNILDDIYNLPNHATEIIEYVNTHVYTQVNEVNNIVYCGMGSSGISGAIIKSYLNDELSVPFMVYKGYDLPKFVGKHTLVICVSYSGETEETLHMYNEALKRGSTILIITSGGQLLKNAQVNHHQLVAVPTGLQSHVATGYILYGLLMLLNQIGILNNKEEINASIKLLKTMRDETLAPNVETKKNIAKEVANDLKDKLPIIYASNDLMGAVAVRWKQQINEMAKNMAFMNTYPELTHNELVSFEFPNHIVDNTVLISLCSVYDHKYNILKRDVSEQEILGYDVDHIIRINAWGKTKLAQITSLMYIGDYMATYLAILNNTNPAQVDKITELKTKTK